MDIGELGYSIGYTYGLPILLAGAIAFGVYLWLYRRRHR